MLFLSASLFFFYLSILIFFDLSKSALWKVSIFTSECSHWLLFFPVGIAFFCRFQNPLHGTATVLSLAASALFLFPIFSALRIASNLPDRFDQVFGPIKHRFNIHTPFRLSSLWSFVPIKRVKKEKISFVNRRGETMHCIFFPSLLDVPAPCVVVLHTGGWDSGSPEEFESLNHILAAEGYAVAAATYRFAPTHRWPAQKEDVLDLIAFLKTNGRKYNIDPEKFVLFGRSAGGQIAEAVAYSGNEPSIRGCIAFYAPADLHFAYQYLSPEPDILDSRSLIENFLGGSPREAQTNYDDASSYHRVSETTPPTLLLHGSKDPITWYRQSDRLDAKLKEYSVPHLYIELPWGTHAFDYFRNGPGEQISRYAVVRFLRAVVE